MSDWSNLLSPSSFDWKEQRRPDQVHFGRQVLKLREAEAALVAFVGFPEDRGVQRNFGRPGAARAPQAIREQLSRLPCQIPVDVVDVGDIKLGADVAESQQALGTVVASLLKLGLLPIVLGGGHETSFGTFSGLTELDKPVVALNLDAHFDLRELIDGCAHSGSPFKQMLEHSSPLESYWICGVNRLANDAETFTLAEQERIRVRVDEAAYPGRIKSFAESAEAHARALQGTMLVSLDLDIIDQSNCPGVSAPNRAGLSPSQVAEYLESAAAINVPFVLDIVELNPSVDVENQSAALVARLIAQFLLKRFMR